jgi:uncharacterized protein (TIGR02611 family)
VASDDQPHPIIQRLQARRERQLERSRFYRAVFILVGFTVLLAGLAMLVLPGPGLLVIVVALTILAVEFAWAERMLERAINRMERAREVTTQASGWQKIFGALALTAATAAAVAGGIYLDLPLLPF